MLKLWTWTSCEKTTSIRSQSCVMCFSELVYTDISEKCSGLLEIVVFVRKYCCFDTFGVNKKYAGKLPRRYRKKTPRVTQLGA